MRCLVQELVGIVVSGYPECGQILVQVEFGQFVADDEVSQCLLLGELVAESESVVEQAETHYDGASVGRIRPGLLPQVDGHLVVTVADLLLLAPDRLPCVVYGSPPDTVYAEALVHLCRMQDRIALCYSPVVHERLDVVHSAFMTDVETHPAFVYHPLSVKGQGIDRLAESAQLERQLKSLVG